MHTLRKSKAIDLVRCNKVIICEGRKSIDPFIIKRNVHKGGEIISGPNPVITNLIRRNTYHNKITGSSDDLSHPTEDLIPREQLKKAYRDAYNYCRCKRF